MILRVSHASGVLLCLSLIFAISERANSSHPPAKRFKSKLRLTSDDGKTWRHNSTPAVLIKTPKEVFVSRITLNCVKSQEGRYGCSNGLEIERRWPHGWWEGSVGVWTFGAKSLSIIVLLMVLGELMRLNHGPNPFLLNCCIIVAFTLVLFWINEIINGDPPLSFLQSSSEKKILSYYLPFQNKTKMDTRLGIEEITVKCMYEVPPYFWKSWMHMVGLRNTYTTCRTVVQIRDDEDLGEKVVLHLVMKKKWETGFGHILLSFIINLFLVNYIILVSEVMLNHVHGVLTPIFGFPYGDDQAKIFIVLSSFIMYYILWGSKPEYLEDEEDILLYAI